MTFYKGTGLILRSSLRVVIAVLIMMTAADTVRGQHSKYQGRLRANECPLLQTIHTHLLTALAWHDVRIPYTYMSIYTWTAPVRPPSGTS